jgi:hypothetical protein
MVLGFARPHNSSIEAVSFRHPQCLSHCLMALSESLTKAHLATVVGRRISLPKGRRTVVTVGVIKRAFGAGRL